MVVRPSLFLAVACSTCLGLVSPAPLAEDIGGPARLTYTKYLKGSSPEYLAISVDASGAATYDARKRDEAPSLRRFQLSASSTRRLFEFVAALDNFCSIDLESHKKVANLGLKTFTYQRGGEKNQAEFNYTLRREAQELTDLFERIGSVEQHISTLEYAIKYDHLSLPKELLQIEIDLDNKALTDAQLMVPALERIARNPSFLRLAQVRAQSILDRLQTSNQ